MKPLILKNQAIALRKAGYSIKQIAKMLGIAVSTSSVWLCDVELKTPAKKRIDRRSAEARQRGALERKRRLGVIYDTIENNVQEELTSLKLDKTLRRLLCAFLYWGEGAKTSKDLRFVNSDPKIIQTFLYLLRMSFEINDLKLRARLHLHEYHNEKKQLIFWSKITKIPIHRISIYRKPNTGKRIRLDYPGCISINYGDSKIFTALTGYYRFFNPGGLV